MHIETDIDRCIGAGQCALTAPDIFDSDEDGFVRVLTGTPDEARLDAVREAVELCPARAITLREHGPSSPDGER